MRTSSNAIILAATFGLALTGCDLNLDQLADKAVETADRIAEQACSATLPVCSPGCDGSDRCVYDPSASTCECVSAADAVNYSSVAPVAGDDPGPGVLATGRATRSTTIDLTADDRWLAMVNSDEGSVSLFDVQPGQESLVARVATSKKLAASEPAALAFHPDRQRLFVANRATGTVSRIVDVQSPYPRLDAELDVGGEPVGLALEPTGKTLWVSNWVTGKVHLIDTASMKVVRELAVGGNPWAIAITNDGDADGSDEKVLVTQFFGRPRPGVESEGTDDGREGVVQVIDTYDPSRVREITLAPVEKCFVTPDLTSGCFPNQLLGITVNSAYGYTRAYVVSVAASPRGPVLFNHNVQALVSVIDLESERELPQLTTNLNQGVAAQVDGDGDDTKGRRFLNTPNAIEFVNGPDAAVGYVTAAGSDIVLRVAFGQDDSVRVGTPDVLNIPVGQNPTGLVVTHRREAPAAFVSNLISRDVSLLALGPQSKLKDIASGERPAPGTPEFDVLRGKRFFNTSTGIWSREGWGSCQSCHPLGLTDNVTWQFAAGPRQTISMDGQYASHDPSDMRALNWTAIFDETDDFENNTRGVSGGTGAVRNDAGPIVSATGAAFSAVVMEDGVTTENHQNLSGSMKFLSRNEDVCTNEETCPDWDQIDLYVQTIRSPRGDDGADTSDDYALDRGRELFEYGGCVKCHSGPKWTISRTFYTPEQFSGELGARLFEANRALATPLDVSSLLTLGLAPDVNVDTTLLAGDDSDGGTPALIRQACNVRNVGTFGAEGGAAEVRANQEPAQGRNGFNPPSLLNIVTGAPFFHNGAAPTLDAVLDARFSAHFTAGNEYFYPTERERADLAAFLRSIDEDTVPFDVIPESVICPLDFSSAPPAYEEPAYEEPAYEEPTYDEYGY
jgi:YVTN family beta-propeller protein